MDSQLQATGSQAGMVSWSEPGSSTGRKRGRDTDPPEDAVKRKKLSGYHPAIVARDNGYFIPGDLAEKNGILMMPDPEVRKAINEFQVRHLESAVSPTHNQGVHLKADSPSIPGGQVVAIYEGCQIRCRYLTGQEMKMAGCPAEPDAYKWLVWRMSANEPALDKRIPSFQTSNQHLFYLDKHEEKVWLGIDAIDSPFPISNINHSSNQDNILLLPCISPTLLSPGREQDLKLSGPPRADDFCFIAVSCRTIKPGEELRLNYQAGEPGKHSYFWGPEHYFHPRTARKPVRVSFSDEGGTASITAGEASEVHCPYKISFEIGRSLLAGLDLVGIAQDMHGKEINPLTGTKQWTSGGVQRLCELLNLEHFKMDYLYPSYLGFCLSAGRLDNAGKNYLAGFLRRSSLCKEEPEKTPETLDEAIHILEPLVTAQIPADERSCQLRKEQESLYRELRWLKQVRALSEEPQSDPDEQLQARMELDDAIMLREPERAKERLCNIISQVQIASMSGEEDNLDKFTRLVLFRFNRYFPWTPAGLWPGIMREGKWSAAHLRLLGHLLPPMPDIIKPYDDLDILACYQPGHPEYIEAMGRVLVREYKISSLGEMIPKMRSQGFVGPSRRGDRQEDSNRKAYLIPCLESIPPELQGTSDWSSLNDNHWQALGLELAPPMEKLKGIIERAIKGGTIKTYKIFIVNHAQLWTQLPEIKRDIKTQKPQSNVLLRYLIHVSGVRLDKDALPIYRCTPEDILSVCDPESGEYRRAMTEFLAKCLHEKMNAFDIARKLDKFSSTPNPFVSGASRKLTRIELPDCLRERYDNKWTGKAVAQLISDYSVQVPAGVELLPDLRGQLKAIVEKRIEGANSTKEINSRLNNWLVRNRDLCSKLASVSGLDAEKIRLSAGPANRVMLHELNIRPGELPKELQLLETDRFRLTSIDSPQWPQRLVEVVHYFLGLGHSLSYIAYRLQEGATNAREQRFLAVPVPRPFSDTKTSWDYSVLKDFLESQGIDVTGLPQQFPNSRDCLELERRVFASGSVSVRDGMLIDRMLCPAYAYPPKSRARVTQMAKYLKTNLLQGTNDELMARFAELQSMGQ